MRTINYIYTSKEDFSSFLKSHHIDPMTNMLVRVHTAIHGAKELPEFLATLRGMLCNAHFVGCNTSTVVYNGQNMSDVCMVSLTLLDGCTAKSAYLPCIAEGKVIKPSQIVQSLVTALSLQDDGFLFVFVPPFYKYCSELAQYLSDYAPHIRIAGGVAHDNFAVDRHSIAGAKLCTFTHEGCGVHGIAVAYLRGDQLFSTSFYSLGMEEISEEYRVTKSEGNYIYEIDGQDAVTWMADMVGNEIVQGAFGVDDVFNILPLVRVDKANTAWLMEFRIDSEGKQSIALTDCLDPGETVRIGYYSPNVVVFEVMQMYQELIKKPVESVFAYSCVLRLMLMQNCSLWEMGPLHGSSVSGAYLGGEFFHDGKQCRFGNGMFTLNTLSSNAEARLALNLQGLNETHQLHHDNEHLVYYLMTCAKHSKGGIYSEMKSKLYADERQELGNVTKLSYDMQMHHLDKLCMLSISNASDLIAYAGFRSYESMFEQTRHPIAQFIHAYPIRYYLTEQGELLIATDASIDGELFIRMMHDLDEFLSTAEYRRMLPLFEFCLVINEVNLLRNAKAVQSLLRTDQTRHFMVYKPGMGMEESSANTMRILGIINDAIAHQRVIPHYQGIHDNRANRINMYESLMRITDADGTMYYPNTFLPVARKYGLYGSLSKRMINQVMQTFETEQYDVTINLSMQDLLDQKMVELIYENMDRTRVPQRFIFEIVESEDVNDYRILDDFSDRIHGYGGKIALDDFGSGYSNLVHVIGIDFDFLKIDGEIIRKICFNQDCQDLLELVSMWCMHHKKKVIAEYVENEEIQEKLQSYGVQYSQGYLFSKPRRLFA